MDCSLPGSSVHGILQLRMLEWVAISSSRGPSWPRDRTCISCVSCVSCIAGRLITTAPPGKMHGCCSSPQMCSVFIQVYIECFLCALYFDKIWSIFEAVNHQEEGLKGWLFRWSGSITSRKYATADVYPLFPCMHSLAHYQCHPPEGYISYKGWTYMDTA